MPDPDQDDIPTTPAHNLWKVNHDHVAGIAERLYDWACSRREGLDIISRRSVYSRDHQRITEALRLRDTALATAFSLARWQVVQPTPEECNRLFQLVRDLEDKATSVMQMGTV